MHVTPNAEVGTDNTPFQQHLLTDIIHFPLKHKAKCLYVTQSYKSVLNS